MIDFVAIGLGILSLIIAYGLWTGRRWAWILGVIGAIIGILLGVLVIAINLVGGSGILESISSSPREPLVPIILYVPILAWLSTRSVRAFCGRLGGAAFVNLEVLPSAGQPYVALGRTQSPYAKPSCTNCGRPMLPGANFCDWCGKRLE